MEFDAVTNETRNLPYSIPFGALIYYIKIKAIRSDTSLYETSEEWSFNAFITYFSILLHRLTRLSSIRELTVSDNVNYTSFINHLNMMTRLESIRSMEELHKILLLLKENKSLMECLQKRAIRKLFLQNDYQMFKI